MTRFGEELRRLRKRSGLTQELLAVGAGLSTEAVSLLERGRRTPRMTTMRLLADGMRLAPVDRATFYESAEPPATGAATVPTFADSPVGREGEIAKICDLIQLADSRLVTLLGPAGVGKTRIAVACAAAMARRFPDGVHWLAVGPPSDGAALLAMVATALGMQVSPGVAPDDIAEHLRDRAVLLIIDNAQDQLLACANLVRFLTAAAPRLTILVTSRHLTMVPGELVVTVPPLRLPAAGSNAPQLLLTAASRLFLSRAGLGGLDAADADAVVRICNRLDGLPGALELAAARTAVLTVQELAEALDTELSILQSSELDAGLDLAGATLSLSHTLPVDRERLVFERLSVFADSFTPEAVIAVCGGGPGTPVVLADPFDCAEPMMFGEQTVEPTALDLLQVQRSTLRDQMVKLVEDGALAQYDDRQLIEFMQGEERDQSGSPLLQHAIIAECQARDLPAKLGQSSTRDAYDLLACRAAL
jgi:transcriptional regulator with XRE-family HTH domain